jgi:hypothetical protein
LASRSGLAARAVGADPYSIGSHGSQGYHQQTVPQHPHGAAGFRAPDGLGVAGYHGWLPDGAPAQWAGVDPVWPSAQDGVYASRAHASFIAEQAGAHRPHGGFGEDAADREQFELESRNELLVRRVRELEEAELGRKMLARRVRRSGL